MASGISAATPLGPSGSPMSVEVNTSRDSVPSAWPSCEPNAMPPICDIIASRGPAMLLASSGSVDAHTPAICSATGSHSRFQVSRVLSIQSLGVHAADLVVPAGSGVTPSSQVSARRTASAMALVVALGHRFDESDRAGRQLAGEVVVDRPGLLAAHHVAGAAEHLAELGEDLAEVVHVEARPAEPERIRLGARVRVLLGLVAVGVVPGGEAKGQVSHVLNGTHHSVVRWARGSR